MEKRVAIYLPSKFRTIIQWLGARWFPAFAGVLLVEAGKQIYAASGDPAPARRRRYVQMAPGAKRIAVSPGAEERSPARR